MRTQEFRAGQQNALSVFQVCYEASGCTSEEKLEMAKAMLMDGIAFEVAGSWLDRYVRAARNQLGSNPGGMPPKVPNKLLNSVEDDYARYRQDHGLTDQAQAEEEHPRIEHGRQAVQILKAGS